VLSGEIQQYVIIDRIGTMSEYIPHLFGATNRFNGLARLLRMT
jgi:hypothetical protein